MDFTLFGPFKGFNDPFTEFYIIKVEGFEVIPVPEI